MIEKVSIIIPCYNEEKWIVKTVNEILKNCNVYEILISNYNQQIVS